MTMSTSIFHSWPSRWNLALVAILSLVPCATSTTIEAAPLVIAPSQYWEGNDGSWSTFPMQFGSSKNITRVLVSTAIPNQWVVLQEACNTTSCASSRGDGLFNPNKSSTWNDTGIYNLYYEGNLNYTGNGDYGFDTVGLGFNPTNTSTVPDTVVVGIVADDFWFGYLGINPQVTNIQNFSTSIPSLIQSLKTNGDIPSLSYSYTAGAHYRNKGVYGQLIFGGYDTSRFQANNIDFNMAGDVTRDLVVGIQSLQAQETSGKTTNLLNTGVLAYIDSTVPWFVLPDDTCDQIEQTFGISQDSKTGLYLITDSQHTALLSRNPNFTFFLGNDESGGNTVPITLPYSSFDLQVSAPYVNTTTKYFPLKRGNDTTYTLGRAFLQEVYLTANYEHQNFSVSQALFNEGAQASIQPVHALGYVSPTGSSSSASGSSGGIPTGAIVGIVIAVVIILIAITTLLVLRHLRRWPFHRRQFSHPPELDGNGNVIAHEKDGVPTTARQPINIKNAAYGVANSKDDLHGYYRPELGGEETSIYKSELPGGAVRRNELIASHGASEVEGSPGIVMELAGSPVGHEYFRREKMQNSSQNGLDAPNSSLHPRSPRSPHSLLANSGTLGSSTTAGHSPISPHRGSDISSDPGRLSPRGGSRGTSPGSRTPVSPQTPSGRHFDPVPEIPTQISPSRSQR